VASSTARARARPISASSATTALTTGLIAAIRSRWASSSSVADTCLAPINRRCSTAVKSTSSRISTVITASYAATPFAQLRVDAA
jgi:hypothetical protein